MGNIAIVEQLLRESPEGLTDEEIAEKTGLLIHDVMDAIKELKPYTVGPRRRTLVQPEPESNMFRQKMQIIQDVEKYFLHNDLLSAEDVRRTFDVSRVSAFRYIREIKHKLRSDDRHDGYFRYSPTAEDIEMARLVLRRVIEDDNLTEEDLALAQLIINKAART